MILRHNGETNDKTSSGIRVTILKYLYLPMNGSLFYDPSFLFSRERVHGEGHQGLSDRTHPLSRNLQFPPIQAATLSCTKFHSSILSLRARFCSRHVGTSISRD